MKKEEYERVSWAIADQYGTAPQAHGLLLIGSHATIEKPIIGLRELQSIRWHIYSSYAMPSDDRLARVGVVFVYDIEEDRRYQQLKRCCDYQREYGRVQKIFAVLHHLDDALADRVMNELGALPIPG